LKSARIRCVCHSSARHRPPSSKQGLHKSHE
jgi:hypothetical protein